MKKFCVIGILCAWLLSACMNNEAELQPLTAESAVTERKIYIDPVTGLPATPPTGDPQLRQPRSDPKTLPPLVEKVNADGSVSIDLNGRFQSSLVVKQDCKGHLKVRHDKTANIKAEKCPADMNSQGGGQ